MTLIPKAVVDCVLMLDFSHPGFIVIIGVDVDSDFIILGCVL